MALGNKEIMSENIKHYMQQKGKDRNDLVADLNLKYMTVSDWINGKTYPRIDKIELLADYFGIKKSDLVEQKQASSTTLQSIQKVVDQLEEPRKLNVLTYSEKQLDEQERAQRDVSDIIYLYDYYDHPASAGTGQYLTDVAVEQIELPVEIDADFVIPISGDSMEPDYYDGDYIFVKLSVDLASGDIGVFDYDGDAYVKQLIIEDGQAHLHSLNPDYPDKPITPETNFRIIGEVVGRYGKEVKNYKNIKNS